MNLKPFPWKCSVCRQKTVYPVRATYTLTVEHDGRAYEIAVPDVDLPTCARCGEVVVTQDISTRVSTELRRAAGLPAVPDVP